jgi:predicted nucleic acid-binding protein
MARTEKVVADASVVVKWYNLEAETEEALKLRDDYAARRIELTAPFLITYEVVNALRYNPDFGVETVKSAVKDLMDMQMNLQLLDASQAQRAVELAFKYGITFYDATYLSLAQTEGIKLYTADGRLITKVPDQTIRHIRDYK